MRPKKISDDDILSFLSDESEIDGFSDDSDADKTWQPPVSNKNIEDEEEDIDDGQEDIDDGQVSGHIIISGIAQTPITVANTGWVPNAFNGIQLPEHQYGPHAFKVKKKNIFQLLTLTK